MRTAPPRVSVVSTFLNAQRFIADAIHSVLSQHFDDLELILIDDGSTHQCTQIARAHADRYAPAVRYLDHSGHRNRGISASRNVGVAAARGEFIAFIDADDVWEPGKLAEQVAIMDARPDVAMVCGAARYWRSWNGGTDEIVQTGNTSNVTLRPPDAALALYPLGAGPSPCPSDMLLRRDLVTALGGFEEHFIGPRLLYEDQAFLAKLYLIASVYLSDRVWINYRIHPESCGAQVLRQGHYDEVRRYFLTWLDRYLDTVADPDPRVRAAIQRNLWRFHHPVLYAALHRCSEILQKSRDLTQRLSRPALNV